MLIYWLTTFLGSLFCLLGTRTKAWGNKVLYLFFVAAVCAVFCFIAGARDLSVGTDTSGYGIEAYTHAINNPFSDFSTYRTDFGIGAHLVFWLSAKIGRTTFWYFFLLELLTVLPVTISCLITLKDKAWLGIFVFGAFFYPATFNLIRQSMAMGFILLALSYLLEKKVAPSLLWFFVGCLLHKTAVICIIFYISAVIFTYCRKENLNLLLLVTVAVAGYIVAVIYYLLPDLPISGHFNYYLSSQDASSWRVVLFFAVTNALPCVFYFIFRDRDNTSNIRSIYCLIALVITGIFSFTLGMQSFYLYRIGTYYTFPTILLFPLISTHLKSGIEKNIYVCFLVILLCCFGLCYYQIMGQNEVVPYVFSSINY